MDFELDCIGKWMKDDVEVEVPRKRKVWQYQRMSEGTHKVKRPAPSMTERDPRSYRFGNNGMNRSERLKSQGMNDCGKRLFLNNLPMEIACTTLEDVEDDNEQTITFSYENVHENYGNGKTYNEPITFIDTETEDNNDELESYDDHDSLSDVLNSDNDDEPQEEEGN